MTLIRRQDSLLPSVWNNLFENTLFSHPLNGHSEFTIPPVNISEDDKSFYVDLAVPGLNKEDFKLDLDKNVMTISAEKSTENEEKTVNYSKKEFGYQSFSRSFTLPSSANLEGIKAGYENGVLRITVAKKDSNKETSVRRISID
ncbi:MAG: Hsp20/alpha crystallin family protein [Flavobacteriales bacterium]|nr:Hsp20/alpha crystallin family protein [Flavobacteriales bacterium]